MANHSKRISGTNPTATSFIKDEDAYLQATTEANGDGSVEVLDRPLKNAGGSQKKTRNTSSSQKKRPTTSGSQKKRPTTSGSQKRTRDTRSKHITLSVLEPDIGVLPLGAVAEKHGVCESTLRARCRKLGILGWPKKGNVNNVDDRLRIREIELFLMDIDTCPENMDYEADAALKEIVQEFEALI